MTSDTQLKAIPLYLWSELLNFTFQELGNCVFLLAKPAKGMNQHSHLFQILHSERVPKSPISTKTAQILLLVRAPEAEAGNVSLCWRIDRLLRRLVQITII